MEQAELLELMRQFDASGMTRLEWSNDGTHVVLEKALPAPQMISVAPVQAAVPCSAAQVPEAAAQPAPAAQTNVVCVKAPLVGVFYACSAPGTPPFVEQGAQVKKGQVLCLIEAMKMMNELTCPVDGTLTRVCAANEEVVSFDQVLFEVTPC